MDSQQSDTLVAAARVLASCRSVLFLTGAGISADSGMPTYRGIGGLYEIEATEEGLPIEEILSGPMLAANPRLTWKYLAQIAEAARGARFNRAHEVIAAWERRLPRVWTVTQNVDGLHAAAGSQNLIEIHGNMRSLLCTGCGERAEVDEQTELELPPRCLYCRSILRPDVVLFGELLPEAALRVLQHELERGFDAVVSIGTSAVFPYIQEPFLQARRQGKPAIEINPSETLLTPCATYHLAMRAAPALDALWQRWLASRS